MHIRNQRDFWAGIMFIAIGVTFMFLSMQYQIGSAGKMGPGYFPFVLGGLMTFLGILIALSGVAKGATETKLSPVGWRELFLVLIAIALFAGLLNSMGVIVALVAMIFVAAFASHEFGWLATIGTAIVLCIMAWAIFVVGLELQFPLWPTFLTR
ncbi:MAG: tripartite tricarboxylate transporter TctB family protein [Burkholderiaceae bacterium]